MFHFVLLFNKQGKTRLSRWFTSEYNAKAKLKTARDASILVLSRPSNVSNVIEWKDLKLIYKRYASLYFCACVDLTDNELLALEQIHLFVEVLDRYFGNVCELDLIFHFHQAYFILDEIVLGGSMQETSKQDILKACVTQDGLMSSRSGQTDTKTNIVKRFMNR